MEKVHVAIRPLAVVTESWKQSMSNLQAFNPLYEFQALETCREQ